MVSEEHPETLKWRQIRNKFADLLNTFVYESKMVSIYLYHVFT